MERDRDCLEFTPRDIKLSHKDLRPLPFSDCQRIWIFSWGIEFHYEYGEHNSFFTIFFEDSEVLAYPSDYASPIEDRHVIDPSVFNWSFVEPINLSANPLPLN